MIRAPSALNDGLSASQFGRSIVTGGGLYDEYRTVGILCPASPYESSATDTLTEFGIVFYRQVVHPTQDASGTSDVAGIGSSRRFPVETTSWLEQQTLMVNGFLNARSSAINAEQGSFPGYNGTADNPWAVGMYQYFTGGFAVSRTEDRSHGPGTQATNPSRAAGSMPRIYLQSMGLPR